ncbi:MAG: ATP-binding protein, partial [Bacteroidales bacterium]|nr:ATP-binding protein [Bacteroidales bacterium]
MLQSIYIKNLFGLYTYTIDLKPDAKIRFITGPNGYGKTTILNALEDVFTGDFKNLVKIHFGDCPGFCVNGKRELDFRS